MMDAIRLYAKYNEHADSLLFDLLDRHDETMIVRPEGAYFVSILGLLNHILLANLNWMARFRDGGIPAGVLSDPRLQFDHPGWTNNLYDRYGPTRARQRQLDDLMIAFAAEMDEPMSRQEFPFTTSHGEHHCLRVGEVLLHVFNHATHHRGQISQILDVQGVEHDFSNLIAVLDEVDHTAGA
jgi:uncharacterized damage-inducible protein DinB